MKKEKRSFILSFVLIILTLPTTYVLNIFVESFVSKLSICAKNDFRTGKSAKLAYWFGLTKIEEKVKMDVGNKTPLLLRR